MNDTTTNENTTKLLRRARFSKERRRLAQFKERLAACPHWVCGADLIAGIDETLRDIDALEERLASKAVIAVVGGTGVGKSSLVNAVCGRPHAVLAGKSRPTTRKAAAVVRSVQDADVLLNHFDPGDLEVLPVPETILPDAVLIDAPDTDSEECEKYSDILDRVLENADVLVCVFDARNPKRKDNLDRLAHFVAKFQGQHVVLALNHADLVPTESLERDVIPDFRNELVKSWPGAESAKLFCTAAAPIATSKGVLKNEIKDLLLFLQGVTGKSFLDERVARAAFLRESAENEILSIVRKQGDWNKLADEVRSFEANISKQLAERFPATENGAEDDMTALLRVATPLWWGPAGLFLGFSRRFRRLVQTPFRLSDLLLPLGLLRRIRAFAGNEPDSGNTPEKDSVEIAFSWDDLPESLRLEYASLSERMVGDFGMDSSLRDEKSAFAFADLSAIFRRSWGTTHDEEVHDAARRRSGLFFQILLNACTIVPAAYILWVIGTTFLRGTYLPGSFYRQAFALLALLWLLSSWFLQICLNRAARSIPDRTAKRFAERIPFARTLPVAAEIERLSAIAEMA